MSIKEEVAAGSDIRPHDSFGHFSLVELRGIVRGRPHSPHLIKSKEAAALLDLAVERLSETGQMGWDMGAATKLVDEHKNLHEDAPG